VLVEEVKLVDMSQLFGGKKQFGRLWSYPAQLSLRVVRQFFFKKKEERK